MSDKASAERNGQAPRRAAPVTLTAGLAVRGARIQRLGTSPMLALVLLGSTQACCSGKELLVIKNAEYWSVDPKGEEVVVRVAHPGKTLGHVTCLFQDGDLRAVVERPPKRWNFGAEFRCPEDARGAPVVSVRYECAGTETVDWLVDGSTRSSICAAD